MTKNIFNNIEHTRQASLKNYNTYHVECIAEYLFQPNNETELLEILKIIKENNLKYLILGNGSNLILECEYFEGAVIKLNKLNSLEYNNYTVTVGAGYSLSKLALETIDKGMSGLEFAAGIPGLVGASTAMNAGAYNHDMSTIVKEVRLITPNLEILSFTNSQMEYTYRDSFIKKNPEYIILSTTFELKPGNVDEMKQMVQEKKIKRIASQPLDLPNAGSVFRNPEGMYAGELIEKLNLKGHNINGAEVSMKHANFIFNRGTARGKDIVELINKIQKEVKHNYNVDLKLEQIIIK